LNLPDIVEIKTGEAKIFYGWIITGVVFINLAMAYGAQYSFGVLFPSLMEEFHWSQQNLSGAFSLYAFLYSFLGIFLSDGPTAMDPGSCSWREASAWGRGSG
jgi:hypothetical protein